MHGGLGLDHSYFRELAETISDEFCCILLDLPNNGRSLTKETDSLTFASLINPVVEFIEKISIEKPIILGASLGANLALDMALHTDAKAIIAISPFNYDLDDIKKGFLACTKSTEISQLAITFFKEPSVELLPSFIERCVPFYEPEPIDPSVIARILLKPEVMLNSIEELLPFCSFEQAMESCTIPSLIIEGEQDPLTNLGFKSRVIHQTPLACLQTIKNSGHFSFSTQTEKVAESICKFIHSL